MATKREMLEEAIADAKAVKEMAIANAKAALEEAFTPQLNNLFSLKLQEMDTEESEKEESEELEEMMDKDTMDEVDLEELLAELNEEESEEEESEESEESEEEPIGDLTREELEKMIEDILAEEFPELLNKEEGPEAEESEKEESEEEDIELAEILAEIESMDEEGMEDEGMMYEEEELDEEYGNIAVSMSEFLPAILAAFGVVGAAAASTIAQIKKAKSKEEVKNIIDKVKSEAKPEVSEELDEAHSTIESLREDLNEVNLLNAKLLYTNKIFKAKNLTESQKLKVLGSFDKATNVSEVKLVFETLNEGLKVKKDTIKENIGRASKTTNTPIVKQPIVESNEVFKRMQKLAGLI